MNGNFPKNVLIVAIAVLALASCKGSPSNNTPTGPGPTPVASATVTANASNTFSPSTVNLLLGGQVTFTNAGGLHNVNAATFRCSNDDCTGPGGPTEELWSFTMTFPNAGTVAYVCDEHAGVGMTGQIIVQ